MGLEKFVEIKVWHDDIIVLSSKEKILLMTTLLKAWMLGMI